MKFLNLIKQIIQEKKEVYNSLFSIFIFFSIYWILTIFIDPNNAQIILFFLFWSVSLLIFIGSIDIYYEKKRNNIIILKKITIFLFSVSIVVFFIIGLYLTLLIIMDIYYIIPISIHFFITFLIYFILKAQLKKYYKLKKKK